MTSTTRRLSRPPRATVFVAAAATMFVPALTSCGASEEEQTVQQRFACTDANGTVVDDDFCDDDGDGNGGSYFLYSYPSSAYGSSGPTRGTRLTGSSPIPYGNTTARTSAGLSPSGKVSKSTTVTVKSGGLGGGAPGSAGRGGAGGSGGS